MPTQILAVTVAAAWLVPAIASNYPISPESGAWLICVNSYQGEKAEQLAEELAALIRRDYRLQAFVFDRGAEDRQKEQERVQEQRRRQVEGLRNQGITEPVKIHVKTVKIENQFAVLVGPATGVYKDIETARKALDSFRKLPPPPTKFAHAGLSITTGPDGKENVRTAPINPFSMAF